MKIDSYGRVSITEQEAFDALYTGKIKNLAGVTVDGNIEKYNHAISVNADPIPFLEPEEDLNFVDQKFFDESNQCNWFMPDNYCPDLIETLYSLCSTEEQRTRVDQELKLFIEHNMFDLLFYLKFLVDTLKKNKIVWGVGRGSSVASYVLFLLGVHKVDSIKYNLDIHEFLKEKQNGL